MLKGRKKLREKVKLLVQKRRWLKRRDAAVRRNIKRWGKDKAIRIAIYIKRKMNKEWRVKTSDLQRWDAARDKWGWPGIFGTAASTPAK